MNKFALTLEEMAFLGYLTQKEGHYFASRRVEGRDPDVYFLDCEMVETTHGPEVVLIGFGKLKSKADTPTEVSVGISFDRDSFETTTLKVKPVHEVTNYVTQITGVDKDTTFDYTLEEAVKILLGTLCEDDYLVGHHMYTDLKLMNMYHGNVIDCCMVFHHPDGPPYYYSLKDLTKMYLKKAIQTGVHDPLEDGIASYNLIRWADNSGFIKTFWRNIGEKFSPCIDLVAEALNVPVELIDCVYTRGSRAVGTNRPDSDHDLVVVLDEKCKLINGTLTRYGNVDICSYDRTYFKKLLSDNIVWAIECIYCPSEMIYIEKTNHREFFEEYRKSHLISSNESLRKSVCFESSRKIASAKKHFLNGDFSHARKHVFIAIRFMDYGRQIVKFNKLVNMRNVNNFWETLRTLSVSEIKTYNEFKNVWQKTYIDLCREFSSHIPKKRYTLNSSEKVDSGSIDSMSSTINPSVRNDQVKNCIQHLLDNMNNLEEICAEQYINVNRSKITPELVLLRYTNRTPDTVLKYVCRGVIFDTRERKLVAYPFNNFVGEYAESLVRYYFEKIDGSFASLYFYKGCWRVSTSRNPDGDSVIGVRKRCKIVFDVLFWETFREKGYDVSILNPNCTYMFELVSKDHVVVVQYDYDDLILTGVRCIDSPDFEEIDIMNKEFDQFTRPKIYSDLSVIDTMDRDKQEGLVIVTDNFDRVKIKTPDYVRKAHMFPLCVRGKQLNLNLHALKVVQENEEKEFCKYCPEYAEIVVGVRKEFDNFITNITKLYDEVVRLCSTRKDFAVYVQKYDRIYHKYLFALYDKVDPVNFMSSITTKRLYTDIFVKGKTAITHSRKTNDYGYTPENKYGKFAEDVKRWEQIQTDNSKLIVLKDKVDVDSVRFVGGLDISFDKEDDTVGVAYITVYDVKEQKIVFELHKKCKLTTPYISGFLGFREVPEYVELLEMVKHDSPEFFPEVLMMDGFGVLHHRGFGSASHIGFETGIPSIGVAKTLLFVDGLDEKVIKEKFRESCKNVGDFIELVGTSGKVYGVAYKSAKDIINPIYISVGHNISLESCIKLVTLTTKFRIPEPIRNSDIKSKLFMK
ncbi:endonuclease V [Yasminevirus sp. GU-2018]|uniref:Endonuclease V n=1 Tax=Yasminevirus sp. GU-2018 TaxID=2420051 RepID=A0A5K0U7I7_9VIRU|nr:endonuclease V [Yasminevirus sp. GU-2018]